MRILIAEDDPTLRDNLQWMLELEGYEVFAACDGADAAVQAQNQRPDLVLTDVMMPQLDGYGLIQALRSDTRTATVPVIMLTAKADHSDVRAGMNLGADDYLTKPCRREELLDAIRARLQRSNSLEQAALRLQTETRRAMQIDTLTGLPGRDLFELQLHTALDQHTCAALIIIGLDGFAKINESLGTSVGDLVLRETGRRLKLDAAQWAQATMHDAVGRIGGDQFAVCSAGVAHEDALQERARQMLHQLAQPYLVGGHTLFLTACAGGGLYPQQADSPHALLLHAESALHHAKPMGPGSYACFDVAMKGQVARSLHIHNELHHAIAQGDLQVYYQPQVSVLTGAVVGFEALLRWPHATLGWIPLSEFIPIAEQSGVIVQLGHWVMHTAARQAAQWLAQGHTGFRMAVNLSVRQFAGQELPALVAQVLHDTGLPPGMLELEVTESLALQSVNATLATLHACKALGVKLAMDDFGTGYSSLAYLKQYPLDALKIDQAFIRNITQDSGDASITRTIVAMAHSFGMTVIAEGVETEEQLAFLRELHCEEFQGYLFSKPVPAEEAERCFDRYRGAEQAPISRPISPSLTTP